MGLTAEMELGLRDAGLINFYEDHEEAFAEMFTASQEYVTTYLDSISMPVRRDDVAKTLVPALTANETLREFLGGKKLRQNYWYRHFADLICDRQWEEDESDDDNDDADG